jgi:hypothetical protein
MELTIYTCGAYLDTDTETASDVSFEFVNGIFDGAQASYTTTLDLSVPATEGNSETLNYNRIPHAKGQRRKAKARLGAGGKSMDGDLSVLSMDGGRFELQFTFGGFAAWVGESLKDLGTKLDGYTFLTKYERAAVTSVGVPVYRAADCAESNVPYNGGYAVPPAVNFAYLVAAVCASKGWRFTFNGVEVTDGDYTGKAADHPSRFVILPGGCTVSDSTTVKVNVWVPTDVSASTISVNGTDDPYPCPLMLSHGLAAGWQDVYYYSLNTYGGRGRRKLHHLAAFKATRDITIRTSGGLVAVCDGNGYPYRANDVDGAHVISLAAGSVMTFAAADAFSVQRGGIVGEESFTTNAAVLMQGYTFEILENDRQPVAGDTVDLGQLSPDMTFAELMDDMCVVIPSVWTADEDTQTVAMNTVEDILSSPSPIVPEALSFDSLTRYISGHSQHNAVKAADTDSLGIYGWSRDYPQDTDLVDVDGTYATLSLQAGAPWGSDFMLFLNNTEAETDGTSGAVTGWKWSGKAAVGYMTDTAVDVKHLWWFDTKAGGQQAIHDIFLNGDEMEVTCRMTFSEFGGVTPRTVAAVAGARWLVRGAVWQDGECVMALVKAEN